MVEIDIKGQADKLRKATSDGGKKYILGDVAWYNVQLHCSSILSLPTDDPSIRIRFQLGEIDKESEFSDARDRFMDMSDHVRHWNSDVLPESINVSTMIQSFGRNAGFHYGDLLTLAEKGLADPEVGERFSATLRKQAKAAKRIEGIANELASIVGKFGEGVNERLPKMVALRDRYLEKYDYDNAEWKKLQKRIENDQKELQAANEEYNKAMSEAAKKVPEYTWVNTFGFLASSDNVETYLKRAAEAKAKMEELQKKINAERGVAEHTLVRNSYIRRTVLSASDSMHDLMTNVERSSRLLELMRSGCDSISEGLNALESLARTNPTEAERIVKAQVRDAVTSWRGLTTEAENYITDAYIKRPGYLEMQVVV